MLIIELKPDLLHNQETNEVFQTKGGIVRLEHSLISVSKWESIWEKPFIDTNASAEKSAPEDISYIQCMAIGPLSDDQALLLYYRHGLEIQQYIQASHTATVIQRYDDNKPHRRSTITSELIYYNMLAYQIPFDCEKWHLNRLLTLIDICHIKNGKGEKMTAREIYQQNKALNAKRRAATGSKG